MIIFNLLYLLICSIICIFLSKALLDNRNILLYTVFSILLVSCNILLNISLFDRYNTFCFCLLPIFVGIGSIRQCIINYLSFKKKEQDEIDTKRKSSHFYKKASQEVANTLSTSAINLEKD